MEESGETAHRDFLRPFEAKWQKKWEEAGAFNAEPDPARPKFFGNYPYSYMNGRPHVGHTFTVMRVEIFSRYKRMKGFNVLFPFAFHCTGTPIVAAAQRIKTGDREQAERLKNMGVAEMDVPLFGDPKKWAEYFPRIWEEEMRSLGVSIDWRRKFITTELNPHYDKFVQWQFRKLKEKGYVALGSHPVIWCPKCGAPVGDHDRVGGEDERITPVEYTLLKFRCGDFYLVAATLRPETVYGQTNLWVDPNVDYVKASVGGETWVVSRECLEKLKSQGHPKAAETGSAPGRLLIGKYCEAPGINREIIVLPSKFCDADMGTGIVTSVPSDAPDDWMALSDLQGDRAECEKWSLSWEDVKKISPIPIIKSKDLGELPAVEICKKLGIKSQTDRANLEKAKEIVYKAGFYTGVMNQNCGEYAGMGAGQAKEEIKRKLIAEGRASKMYEPSGEVTCRCLTKAVVKLVENQWFIKYGNREWKDGVLDAFRNMKLYPEIVRRQFQNVVEWLGDWACSREYGLGSRIPWDTKWVIESLSDSTIYMAYYTISGHLHHGKAVSAEKLDDAFFDYVFLGKGGAADLAPAYGISEAALSQMRSEFLYWYPFDFRNSGKDLIQNHLTFCVFNHVAIFPREHWPRGIGVNGWMLIDGRKMSKSQGATLFLKDAIAEFGADAARLALGIEGEGLDDPSFDADFARGASGRLRQWHEFAISNYHKGREEPNGVDRWFGSRLNMIVRDVTTAMDETRFRTALKVGYFDLQAAYRWYAERCGSSGANRTVRDRFIEAQTKILAPYAPHVCEEIWESLGHKEFISLSAYPEFDEKGIDAGAIAGEEFLKSVLDDTAEILKIFKGAPKKVTYYTSPGWKRKVFAEAIKRHREGKLDAGTLIKAMMADNAMKPHAKEIPKYAQKCAEDLRKMSAEEVTKRSAEIDEAAYLSGAAEFIAGRLGVPVEVHGADEPGIADPAGKARQAVPWRPGIYIE